MDINSLLRRSNLRHTLHHCAINSKGYYVMTDAWFSEFMFQLLVDNAFLSEEHQAQYDTEPTLLKPWDPMGALAHAM
jgi:aminopeptidase C